ncbi:MAG: SWIM zinc finger family protein [Myxococcota bacterium]
MKPWEPSYAAASAVTGSDMLVLITDARRPVSLRARIVRDLLPIRSALLFLGSVCRTHLGSQRTCPGAALDPVVTVHSDALMLECLGEGIHARLLVDPAAMAIEDDIAGGSSTVDVNRWLWEGLGQLRSRGRPKLRLGPKAGKRDVGVAREVRAELDDRWLCRCLELQAAAVACDQRLTLPPAAFDELVQAVARTGSRVFPQALRYTCGSDGSVAAQVEPRDELVLAGARHEAQVQSARVWGRRWLTQLRPLLPFADEVQVFLHRSGWPSFCLVALPSVRVVLGTHGDDAWLYSAGAALREWAPFVAAEFLAPVLTTLVSRRALRMEEVVRETGLGALEVKQALGRLCRAGRALYEVDTGIFRHRELFSVPLDIASLERLDPQRAAAEAIVRDDGVEVDMCGPDEEGAGHGPGVREVVATVGQGMRTRIAVRDGGKIVFGACSCPHFRQWMMSRGPCVHMSAVALATEGRRLWARC